MVSSLNAQATAVERAAVNLRGHVDNLENLVRKGRRPATELELARAWLPDLLAAAVTMRRLADDAASPTNRRANVTE